MPGRSVFTGSKLDGAPAGVPAGVPAVLPARGPARARLASARKVEASGERGR